jgi:hypothetical protein
VPKWCPFAVAEQAAHPRARFHPGDVGVDAEGHTRIAVTHLCGGHSGVLAKLGAQRGVGPAERVEGDALRKGRPVFGGQSLVGPLDRRIEDFRPGAVAVPRLVPDATGEEEVVGFAPLGRDLVLAQEPDQLRLEGDLPKAGGGLGDRHPQDARFQIQVLPLQVRQLGDPQAAGHDRRRE